MNEVYLGGNLIKIFPIAWYEKREYPVSKKDVFFRSWLASGGLPIPDEDVDDYAAYNYKINDLTFDEYKRLLYKSSAC